MVKCSDGCMECCDHCKHFDFNGSPVTGPGGKVIMVYAGNGHCRHRNQPEDPGNYCEDFHCRRAKEAT